MFEDLFPWQGDHFLLGIYLVFYCLSFYIDLLMNIILSEPGKFPFLFNSLIVSFKCMHSSMLWPWLLWKQQYFDLFVLPNSLIRYRFLITYSLKWVFSYSFKIFSLYVFKGVYDENLPRGPRSPPSRRRLEYFSIAWLCATFPASDLSIILRVWVLTLLLPWCTNYLL